MNECLSPDFWLLVESPVVISLEVSFVSTMLASVPGILAGIILATESFPGRDVIITILYTALAFPTVVIGLFVYAFLSRSGWLGDWGLLYSKTAIVIGQVILIIPIIATFTLSAVRKLDPLLAVTAKSLGAGRARLYRTLMKEARFGIVAAVIAAFGRAISEVGISMILGGNIQGVTRTMTTMIALEHDKGQFNTALILGFVLLAITLGINILFHHFQAGPEKPDA
jgi:tungstate transport system permease protein